MASNSLNSTRTFMTNASKPDAQLPAPKKRLRLPSVRMIARLLSVVVVCAVIAALYMYFQKDTPQPTAQKSLATSTQKLGKLIILPTDETPTIATVNDASKLKDQAFYAQAKNGDMTYVYPKAQKAILYRPSNNIIVNVAAVTVSDATTDSAQR